MLLHQSRCLGRATATRPGPGHPPTCAGRLLHIGPVAASRGSSEVLPRPQNASSRGPRAFPAAKKGRAGLFRNYYEFLVPKRCYPQKCPRPPMRAHGTIQSKTGFARKTRFDCRGTEREAKQDLEHDRHSVASPFLMKYIYILMLLCLAPLFSARAKQAIRTVTVTDAPLATSGRRWTCACGRSAAARRRNC